MTEVYQHPPLNERLATWHRLGLIDLDLAEANEVMNNAEIEAKSEHWLVWSRRPIIAFAAIFNFILANVLAAFGYAYMDPTEAMYFAMLVNGLDTGSRGIEKLAQTWRNPESIHR